MAGTGSGVDILLKGNLKFVAAGYQAPPAIVEAISKTSGAIIITCLDPRVIPEHFCDFGNGQFPVIRNAGGRVLHVERDIGLLAAALDIKDVMIIHHQDCGLWNFHNDTINSALKGKGLGDPSAPLDFGEILDMDQSVQDDVATLRKSRYLSPKANVHGYVYDMLTTGKLREVAMSWGEGHEFALRA